MNKTICRFKFAFQTVVISAFLCNLAFRSLPAYGGTSFSLRKCRDPFQAIEKASKDLTAWSGSFRGAAIATIYNVATKSSDPQVRVTAIEELSVALKSNIAGTRLEAMQAITNLCDGPASEVDKSAISALKPMLRNWNGGDRAAAIELIKFIGIESGSKDVIFFAGQALKNGFDTLDSQAARRAYKALQRAHQNSK